MDLNRVTLIGHLSTEPEQKQTAAGRSVTRTNIATNFVWKDKSGEQKEKVDFHTIVAWNKLGDRLQQYLKKGDRVYIEGRLDHHSYEKDGVTKYVTDVIAEKMIMLGKSKREVVAEETVVEPITEPF